MSLGDFKRRNIVIVKWEYKPGPDEPKIWYTSESILMTMLYEGYKKHSRKETRERPKKCSIESISS
jgi:hypothetical protein